VILAGLGDFPRGLLDKLSRATRIPVGPALVDPLIARNAERRQCDSTRLLAELKAQYNSPVIAGTTCDLFIPVLTYVFGEAELAGRVAIFSIHRLRDEYYGLRPDPDLLFDRALRELWHESGHLFGLTHCQDSFCVMSSAHSIEQVDDKSHRFCQTCARKLDRQTTFAARIPVFTR
jgi:archaemetzincin